MPPRGKPADPEPEAAAETAEKPVQAASTATRFRVLKQVRYTRKNGDEFIAGPGETIDGDDAKLVDADAVEAV